MRRKRPVEDDSPAIMMEPMIDCVFLLLIFFLVAATIRKQHREIPIEVPSFGNTIEADENHQPPLFLQVSMQAGVDDAGRLNVDANSIAHSLREGVFGEARELSREELLAELGQAGQAGRSLFLETSRNIPYGAVVQTIGLLELYQVRTLGMRFADRYNPTF